ncbi:DUF3987 domain-containing protein [Aureimonas leprariae]|uniref:DUF3987 domain-containing protein n=1 Tax=Plantimonas leprariae TaxID=2615207 RepID=A0A7V7PMI2_9HYPH|nr:DUF3987 domain-containing protein [Aureimonas leprariae]KAB0678059.1 DUF3987 domain-containing protein [Aureimonas leprariae]
MGNIASSLDTNNPWAVVRDRYFVASVPKIVEVPATAEGFASDAAISFLETLDANGRHNLVAIHPETKRVVGRTFEPNDWNAISDWIEERAGRWNIYYSVNEPAAGAPDDKLTKRDIAALRAIVADVDPRGAKPLDDERREIAAKAEVLQCADWAPTVTIDTGGGAQFVWRLSRKLDPAEYIAWAEAQGRGLARELGGDAVQNIDRIMRLPGTLNVPTAEKIAKGRIPRLARITHPTARSYDPEDLRAAVPPLGATTRSAEVVAQADLVGDVAELEKAMRALPNTTALFPRRADMIRVGMALHAASANDPDAGREMFHEWGERWEGGDYDPDVWDKEWASFRSPHEIGAAWIFDKSRDHGGEAGREAAAGRLVARWFDEAIAVRAAATEPVNGKTDPTPRLSEVIDIFGHGDPAELGTPPADALPASIAAWVRTEARRKGVSEAFAAASAIAVAASAIGNSIRLQVRQFDTGWTEPASLWVTLIAPPGSTKSAIISEASKPLRDLETANRKLWKPLHDDWSKAAEAFRRRKKDAVDPGPEPTFRRIVIDNYTSEKALRIFADNPRGLLNTTDELVGALGNIGAYKRSGDGDRALMLRFFDGGDAMMDRVGGGTLYAESALLGIVASSQPDKIGELANGLAGDGFLQRFLFVVHDRRERTGLDEAPDAAACQRYARVVRGLATMEHDRGATIRLSPEAARLREAGLERLRSLKWLFGTSPTLQGHVEKYGKFVARLILTFHCIEQVERSGGVDVRDVVSVATVERAITFAAFLMRHSLEFYREYVGRSDIASEAEWIAEFLLAHPELSHVDKRKIYDAQKSFRGMRGHKKLIAAMLDLETANWVKARPRKDPSDKDIWDINPTIHALFPEHAKRVRAAREESQQRLQAAREARRWANGQSLAASDQQLESAFD